MKINKALLRDIDRNYNKVVSELGSTESIMSRFNRRRSFLRTLVAFHSAALEDPVNSYLCLSAKKRKRASKTLTQSKEQIEEAWKYAYNSEDLFNLETMCNINGYVQGNPEGNQIREARVTLGLSRFTPPNYEALPRLLKSFFERIKNYKKILHPVEIAAESHFSIATLQPFSDGNKRTARLYEGVLLEKQKFPTPVIPTGERILYLDLLEEAGDIASQYNDRAIPRDWNSHFADYLGSKVNCSLERMLGREY